MTDFIDIRTRNLELTDRIETFVTKKASKLQRYLQNIDDIRVDLRHDKSARSAEDRYIAQITVRARRALLRAEVRTDDIFTAFDLALDKIQRQIERYKGKRYYQRERYRESEQPVEEETPEEEGFAVVRRKQFELVPMTEEEAIEQMQLLGHNNFFVFFNANSNTINVLYRRHDGNYGIIEPQVG